MMKGVDKAISFRRNRFKLDFKLDTVKTIKILPIYMISVHK